MDKKTEKVDKRLVMPSDAVQDFLCTRQRMEATYGKSWVNPGMSVFGMFETIVDLLQSRTNGDPAFGYAEDLRRAVNAQQSN